MKMSRKVLSDIDLIPGPILNKGDHPQLNETGKSYPSDYEPPKEYEI